jgi:hypothetical protein
MLNSRETRQEVTGIIEKVTKKSYALGARAFLGIALWMGFMLSSFRTILRLRACEGRYKGLALWLPRMIVTAAVCERRRLQMHLPYLIGLRRFGTVPSHTVFTLARLSGQFPGSCPCYGFFRITLPAFSSIRGKIQGSLCSTPSGLGCLFWWFDVADDEFGV